MKRQNYTFATVTLLACMFACQKAEDSNLILDENATETTEHNNEFITTDGQTLLGDVIDIPYSIENLLKAYENLPARTKSQIDPNDIKPTHYYVRFYPKSIREQDILRNIKPYVFLSETPLDREVVVGGSSYHDPSIPNDLPTFQYTVVPVDRWAELGKTVPVEAEILIKAYIPDYDEAYTTKSEDKYGIPATAYEELLREAYRITGNEYDAIPETKSSWNPSGRIRAKDDYYNAMVAVPGVRVRATHLLKVKEALTDEEGRFTLPSFNSSVTYKIIWESDDWDIRDGLTGQATFDGPNLSTQWFPEIDTTHEKNVRYAATQRAAYRWYYGDVEGLIRPAFSNKLKICQRVEANSHKGVFTHSAAMDWHIEIWIRDSTGAYRTIRNSYEVTAHELGHAAHFSRVNSFNSYCDSIKESWALFVGGVLTQKEYGTYSVEYNVVHEGWPEINHVKYTPIFIDLFDTVNQHELHEYTPNDTVAGFSTTQLNTALLNSSTSLLALKNNLTPLHVGVTMDQINNLFSEYENHWVEDD